MAVEIGWVYCNVIQNWYRTAALLKVHHII